MKPENILTAVQSAIKSRDDSALAIALSTAFSHTPREIVPDLCRILTENWYEQHEDIVLLLQDLKDERAVEALFEAAQMTFKHLIQWNNVHEFQRKCTWALADIGSDRAKQRLSDLVGGRDETVAAYSRERLDNWDIEVNRKGPCK
jgi:hypothetical protein